MNLNPFVCYFIFPALDLRHHTACNYTIFVFICQNYTNKLCNVTFFHVFYKRAYDSYINAFIACLIGHHAFAEF